MPITFEKNKFKKMQPEQIKEKIIEAGFNPVLITNSAGYEYHPHIHPETKLLAFVNGRMTVLVEDSEIVCNAGDLLIIPGDTQHSAVVGKYGCRFFWAEKLAD